MEENPLSVQAQRVNPPACEKFGSRSPSTLRTGRGTVIHCLLTFAQHDDDTGKRHSETSCRTAPINRTTSTARIASSRAAILIRLMAPNDTPNNTAVPGFFMEQQDYHTVRYPLCESVLFLPCWPDSPSLTSPNACPLRPDGTRCPLSFPIASARSRSPIHESGVMHQVDVGGLYGSDPSRLRRTKSCVPEEADEIGISHQWSDQPPIRGSAGYAAKR